jgi:hypothetical protein
VAVAEEQSPWAPNPLAGYTWSTWLAPAYRPNPEACPLADPPAGREARPADERDDPEEIEEDE